jgi:hypothetical protein
MRHIIIGDVHGCLAELEELISLLSPAADDKLYFIGDLVDKGPDSAGVVQYVRRLAENQPLILVLGNHEEKLLRFIQHKETQSAALQQMKNTEKLELLMGQLSTADIQFLSSAYINYIIVEAGVCLLHGGIPGNNKTDLSVNNPYSLDVFKKLKGAELILKTRFLDQAGNFVSLGQEDESSVFWSEVYDGHFGKVIFGHHPVVAAEPTVFPNAINIDTGCVFGGWLTACVIENNQISFKNVKAKQAYATANP